MSSIDYFLEIDIEELTSEIEEKLDEVAALNVEISVLESVLALAKSLQSMRGSKQLKSPPSVTSTISLQQSENGRKRYSMSCTDAIIQLLEKDKYTGSASEIAKELGRSKGTVSCTLSNLRNKGLILSALGERGVLIWRGKHTEEEAKTAFEILSQEGHA